ncbi:hypothetical protein QF021_001977 [Acidovorax delafieldii]|nr:hypothetical protein [Acidovorax delafieldii]
MPVLVNTYGPKLGACNICGVHGPLTEDHTPPKGCYRPSQVDIRHLSYLLAGTPNPPKGRRSQNGVKYRTLCHRCNNTLLGSKYDPPFIEFVNAAAEYLRSTVALPSTVTIPGRPQCIVRSLLGHLSAQGVGRYLKGPLTEAVRDYLLDDSLPLPPGVRVFYWAYPHRIHVMLRDAAYTQLSVGKPFAFWLLKFFPIAFLVAWDEPVGLPYPMHDFESWRSVSINHAADLPLSLSDFPPLLWPEAPTEDSMVMYGQEAIHVV